MKARLKEGVKVRQLGGAEKFIGELKVNQKDGEMFQLSNGFWYSEGFLEFIKEKRGRKKKGENIEIIEVAGVKLKEKEFNYEVLLQEKDVAIQALDKECTSWMNEYKQSRDELHKIRKENNDNLIEIQGKNAKIFNLKDKLRLYGIMLLFFILYSFIITTLFIAKWMY